MKILLLVISLLVSASAFADSKASECTRLWQLEKELGCPAMPSDFVPSAQPVKKENFFSKKTFGPSKCVTSDDLDGQKDLLEAKCEKWKEGQKKDVGDRYLSGTCDSGCEPCPGNPSLQRCNVKGEVHYQEK